MLLTSVRIRDYKCIADSEEFSVGQVTCLVGKNESGKTAILQALHKLKPDDQDRGDFVDLEYPRRKWKPNMAAKDLPRRALETVWKLEGDDLALVEDTLGPGVLTRDEVKITKGYDNVSRWAFSYDEEAMIRHALADASLSAPESNKIRNQERIESTVSTLEAMDSRTPKQEALLVKLKKTYGGNAAKALIRVLSPRLPVFVYFSEYYVLPGKVSLGQFRDKKSKEQLSSADKVFEALLALAGTSAEDIDDITTFERLRASLEAVSNSLSEEIFNYWSQNKHLEVVFSFDAARPGDPPPFNTGHVFRTAIRNNRHKSTVSFDERSSGFVWFFSFLVWFSQIREQYGERLVILLDEPALNLHARAQADLLRYVREKLMPDYQVLYTTHSPFLIDPDNLQWTRTVEDVVATRSDGHEELLGTKVCDDVLATDRDTLSPLHGALGYDITQTLFVGKNTLLVEGPSDLLYIQWMSRLVSSRGGDGLDSRWVVCPVGGLSKVGSFAALFAGNALNVAVLADFHSGEKKKVHSLKESAILKSGHVFTADGYVDGDEADSEDLIGRENYLTLVNSAFGLRDDLKLPLSSTGETPTRVAREVEDHFAVLPPDAPLFDHFTPAAYAIANMDALEAQLPDMAEAVERFERLFKDLNSLLPERFVRSRMEIGD